MRFMAKIFPILDKSGTRPSGKTPPAGEALAPA